MIEYLSYILTQVSNPFNLLLLLVGNMIGIVSGAIPGLSGTLADRKSSRLNCSHMQ